jgi:hypothetical protein
VKNSSTLKIFVLLVVVAALCASSSCASVSSEQRSSQTANVERRASDPTLDKFAAYRSWHLVNPEPVKMDERVAILCAPIFPRGTENPHAEKFISVYVNDAGRDAMFNERSPKFPRGSMIVKEKLGSKESRSPELLTAMLKREEGYDAKNGDWEYLVLDGAATRILEQGKLESCQSCHTWRKQTDYIFRIYAPPDVYRQLK